MLALRAITDADASAVVLSLDGVGAYDHVHRAAFFDKLLASPSLRPLLPLMSALYGTESRFLWRADEGTDHIIVQGEGGEQGCPLMPALYSLAQHDALVEAHSQLSANERIFSFLDDLYVVTRRDTAAASFTAVSECVHRRAGVQSNMGKLRGWCRDGGPAPKGLAAIAPAAWTGDLPADRNGIVVLGSPPGSDAFQAAHASARLAKQAGFLEEIGQLEDVQTAWVLLSQSAVPRAMHMLRTMPPPLARGYAEAHDAAIWTTFCALLGEGARTDDLLARQIATLPGRHGGLGLQSAFRTRCAAYWGAVVDAMPVLMARDPWTAQQLVQTMSEESGTPGSCASEAVAARATLAAAGAEKLPTWREAASEKIAPPVQGSSGENLFRRGWHGYACAFLDIFFFNSHDPMRETSTQRPRLNCERVELPQRSRRHKMREW